MLLKKTCEKEVFKVLNNLDNKSSSGDDKISSIIVKTSAKVVAPYLSCLINLSFTKGVFPKELCKAKVLPLHKDGSKLDENNYSPISLLIVLSKIYERIMYNRIYSYLENFFSFMQNNLVFVISIAQLMHLLNLPKELESILLRMKFLVFSLT